MLAKKGEREDFVTIIVKAVGVDNARTTLGLRDRAVV
jgi:hypothetical protein